MVNKLYMHKWRGILAKCNFTSAVQPKQQTAWHCPGQRSKWLDRITEFICYISFAKYHFSLSHWACDSVYDFSSHWVLIIAPLKIFCFLTFCQVCAPFKLNCERHKYHCLRSADVDRSNITLFRLKKILIYFFIPWCHNNNQMQVFIIDLIT